MKAYAESSAILCWLFREAGWAQVEAVLDQADQVITSDLTLVECDRAFHRAAALDRMAPETAKQTAADLAAEARGWTVLRLAPSVVERARQRFPHEPVRSLDALHMAWALHAKAEHDGLVLLSLDNRVRRVGESLGFDVRP